MMSRNIRADHSNRILVAFLQCALAMPDPMPSGRPKEYRDWTWQEVVDEMQWSGAWLRGARRVAKDMGLV
jgi:hypothetical protein